MTTEQAGGMPVRTKAMVVDPGTMTVVWANESAATGPLGVEDVVGGAVDRVIPLAAELGIHRAIEAVAATGEPHHLHADVIPTRRGAMALVISVYRMPDGPVLVLAENAWEYASRRDGSAGKRGARGRS